MLLRIDRVGVRFGATVALDDVSFAVEAGEVHALVGENGAGKSTVLRLVAGVFAADTGRIEVAPGAEIAWAPQEPVLAPDLTPAEWIFLGRERHSALGLLRQREMRREAAAALRQIGADIDAVARLGDLAAAQRKQVQLARSLYGHPALLLLDEPTAALGTDEAETLFAILRQRRDAGAAVLYVTHRLDEVRALADRVTVLRDGRHISTDSVDAVDTATLVRRMVGRDLPTRVGATREHGGPGTARPTQVDADTALLRVDGLSVAHVRDVSLEVHPGEIVGLAGLVGAGRSEVLEAIAGLRPHRAARLAGAEAAVFVPEDRGGKGLIPTFGLRENLFVPAKQWRLDRRAEATEAEAWISELSIRSRGPETPIDALSGGNQQKLLLARALRRQPSLLLLDEPTAGVDVGAKADIHALVRRLAADGAGILLASSDLPELLSLCDRIVALREGRVAGEVAVDAETDAEHRVGALITGAAEGRERAC